MIDLSRDGGKYIYISGALRVGSALSVVIFFYVECSLTGYPTSCDFFACGTIAAPRTSMRLYSAA